jgi:hypothetical protein
MLKHHCSAFFIPFTPVICPLPKQFRPAIVSPFLLLKHPFSATLYLCHPPSSTKQFRPAIVSPLLLLKHELPATRHHLFMMLKHHCSAPFDFSSDTETPVVSSSSSIVVRFFSVAEAPAFHHYSVSKFLCSHTTVFEQQAVTESKSRRRNSITTNKHQIWLAYEPNGKAKVCKVYVIRLGYN